MDRLVPVEGDDRATLVAVDAPAKVDVVAERTPPVFFRISGRMGRMGSFLWYMSKKYPKTVRGYLLNTLEQKVHTSLNNRYEKRS